MLKFHAAASIAADSAPKTGSAHTPGRYRYIDLFYTVAFGAGGKALALVVQVCDDGSTWRTVYVRDLTTAGGNYVASKALTDDGSGVLRLETFGREVRVAATNTGDNACTLSVEGYVTE